MKMAKKQTAKTKTKKKVWTNILGPKIFNEFLVGESLVYDPNDLIGRTFKLNLMTLTNDIKTQNTNIVLKIKKVRGSDALTEPYGLEIMPTSIKRMVRKSRDRLDLSFLADTKDGYTVRIKPLLITRDNVKGSIQTQMRRLLTVFLKKEISKVDNSILVENIVRNRLQKNVRNKFKKLIPIKIFDIRSVMVVKEGDESKDEPKKEVAKKENQAEEKTEKPEETKTEKSK
jgi:small subunit ribosomal protein S3Ae